MTIENYMKQYFKNLNRIEFVITNACTGHCKHCSEGEHYGQSCHIDVDRGIKLIRELCANYKIESFMTFGGEPLLYPKAVFGLQAAARDMGIPKRHIITNGYFSKDEKKIRKVAQSLAECGVNKILLSVDAFHQERIPLEYVKLFASAVLEAGIFTLAHPAWLVSRADGNPYNIRTREILSEFADMGIAESDGNIVFPEGNALKYLGEYFDNNTKYENPYAEAPDDIRTISVSADGGVLNGNIYVNGILEIMKNYTDEI